MALDHAIIKTLLMGGTFNLATAREIYERGASSLSYAEITLDEPLDIVLNEGTLVVGASFANDMEEVMGTVLETVEEGSNVVKIRYFVRGDQENPVNCRVGGAPEPFYVLDGCTFGCWRSYLCHLGIDSLPFRPFLATRSTSQRNPCFWQQ